MSEKTTSRTTLADLLTFPRGVCPSPESVVFVTIRAIDANGVERVAQSTIPAEKLAELGDELMNG